MTGVQTCALPIYHNRVSPDGLAVAILDGHLRLAVRSQIGEDALRPDLRQALAIMVEGFLATFRRNRNAFNAVMVQNRGVADFRARGARATESAAAQLRELLTERSEQISHPDLDLAADIVFRTLFALATQIVMMDEAEVTGRSLSDQQWVEETTHLLVAYLTTSVDTADH